MADNLVAFLRARLAEDEQAAQAAKPGPWHADGGSVYATHWIDEVVDYSESAEHIARHDPARVLAEVVARRRLLDLHTLEYRDRPERIIGESDDPYCSECFAEGWPCETLRILASPFRDHPDFDAAWAVDTPQ